MAKEILSQPSIFDAFHEIRENANIIPNSTFSYFDWFRNTINKNLNTPDIVEVRQLITSDPSRVQLNRFFLGKLYFFFYNEPEYKISLPFYDTFPLLLLLRRTKNHIFGVNLHYIPPKRRLVKFMELLKYTSDNQLKKGSRIILPYEKMKRDKKWKIFKSCFRQYKINKIQGNIIDISAPDWPIAVNLPVERFKKRGKKEIWSQTIEEELS